jgi:hypothetical protein
VDITAAQIRHLADELRAAAASLDLMADDANPDARYHFRDDSTCVELWRLLIG